MDHVALAKSLGCKAVRVRSPGEFDAAFAKAEALMEEHQVPDVMEFILEWVTNIDRGTEIDGINEFEDISCLDPKSDAGERLGESERNPGFRPRGRPGKNLIDEPN